MIRIEFWALIIRIGFWVLNIGIGFWALIIRMGFAVKRTERRGEQRDTEWQVHPLEQELSEQIKIQASAR